MPPTITMLEPSAAPEAELLAAYELRMVCHRAEAPDEPPQTFAEWARTNLLVPSHIQRRHWTVPGGYASSVWLIGAKVTSAELCVAPRHRRQGLGGALLRVVADQARLVGCNLVLGSYGTAAGAAFAAARGLVRGNSQHTSTLALPAGVPAALPGLPGYTLRSWTDRAPDELLDSYAAARGAIRDAPHSDGAADDPWTPHLVREFEEIVARRGRQTRVTVAVAVAVAGDGGVAAFTELRLSPEPGAVAATEDTATVATHRGRGVATWVKAESLRRLAAERPDVALVKTSNDTRNVGMLAINRKLGFRIVSTRTDVLLDL